MSSLKDIMDVDVEPLESQAYRRSREAAQQPLQPNAPHLSSTQASPSDPREQDQTPVKRRRSNRVSKPGPSQGAAPNLARRRSSSVIDPAEAHGYGQSSSSPPSASTMRQPPRQMDSVDQQIRYTPVTGRISRAKKGQPVHVCDLCDEPRVFSRAEHLRRHQLSHQQPRYPCTFQDCEKAFHRPDLLARHMHRHETQGEKPYKASDAARSRSPSTSTDSHTPPLKVEAPKLNISTMGQVSPSGPVTPHTSASTDSARTATAYEPIMTSFQAVNFATTSNERSTSQSGLDPSAASQANARAAASGSSASMGSLAAPFNPGPLDSTSAGGSFMGLGQAPFENAYQGDLSQVFTTAAQDRLTVQVPDQPGPPSLTYANSPWYSSESAWSTPSDVSRRGSVWPVDPLVPIPGLWDQPITVSPQLTNAPLRGVRSPNGLDIVPEGFESPPYSSPHLSPPMVSYQMVGVPNAMGGYQNAELVGNPTLSRSFKAVAQTFSAIPTSRFPTASWSILDGARGFLVDVEDQNLYQSLVSPPLSVDQLNSYVVSYRKHLEPIFPILRPASYEQKLSGLVSNAVAALGTQFHNGIEDRRIGSHLSQACKKIILSSVEWTIELMQAIVLSEIFDLFRSPRFDSRTSNRFGRLYEYLLQTSITDRDNIFAKLDSSNVSAYLEVQLAPYAIEDPARQRVLENIWKQWIEYETRQRLRATCFILDIHRSMYYGQPRIQPSVNSKTAFLVFPCPDNIWTANNAQEWQKAFLQSGCPAVQLIQPRMPPEQVPLLPHAAQCLVLSALTALLPSNDHSGIAEDASEVITSIRTMFPNFITAHAYIALSFTPVHDLLASTGETWIFGRKITSQPEMMGVRERTLKWSRTSDAAQATWHACHVLRLFLAQNQSQLGPQDASSPIAPGLSDYWAAYTATVICWAFGRVYPSPIGAGLAPAPRHHRSPSAPSSSIPIPMISATSAPSSTATSSATISRRSSWNFSNGTGSHTPDDTASTKNAALMYCDSMIGLGQEQPANLLNANMRGETGAILDAVRAQLGVVAATEGKAQCAMLLDACRVLERLREMSK